MLLLHLWCCFKKTIRFTFITLHLCRHMQAGKTGGYKDLHQFSKRSRIKKTPKTKHCGWRIIIKNKNKWDYIRSISRGHYDGGGRSTLVNSIRIVTHDVAKVGYLLVVLRFFFVCNNFMSHKLVIRRMSSPCPLHHFCVIRMFFFFLILFMCCQNSEAVSYNKVSVKQGCYY